MSVVRALASATSGALADSVFSRNAYGPYVRARTFPTYPASPLQQQRAATMATVSQRWLNVLTQAQRDAWAVWAKHSPRTNALGFLYYLSGQQAYVAHAVFRTVAGVRFIDTVPSAYGTTWVTLPTIALSVALQKVSITATPSDPWNGSAPGRLVIYMSPDRPPQTRTYHEGFRYLGRILGSGSASAVFNTVWPIYTARAYFFEFRAVAPDYTQSTRTQRRAVAVA